MKIYTVEDEYLNFLKEEDPKVMANKVGLRKRPYVGVVMNINGFDYFAPMTSPKNKHKTMKNNIDFMKINGGEHGAININNMVPINKNELVLYDIDNETDLKYKELLQNQARFIKEKKDKIHKNAIKLYDKVVNKKDNNFIRKCCKFEKLEVKCKEYRGTSTNI